MKYKIIENYLLENEVFFYHSQFPWKTFSNHSTLTKTVSSTEDKLVSLSLDSIIDSNITNNHLSKNVCSRQVLPYLSSIIVTSYKFLVNRVTTVRNLKHFIFNSLNLDNGWKRRTVNDYLYYYLLNTPCYFDNSGLNSSLGALLYSDEKVVWVLITVQ